MPTSFHSPNGCAMARHAVPVGSGRGEIVEFERHESSQEAIHRSLGERCAEQLFISRKVGPRRGRWRRLTAPSQRAAAAMERFLLQALRFKLERLDPGAKGFLLADFNQRCCAFELPAKRSDWNDGELAPAAYRLVQFFDSLD